MGMFVVAPASSFHHNNHQHHEPIISNPLSTNGSNPATALGVGVGVGVIPLLTATPCLAPNIDGSVDDENGNGLGGRINRNVGIQFWQQNQQAHQVQHQNAANLFKKTSVFDNGNSCSGPNLVHSGGIVGCGTGPASSTVTCQDCGNQAKKDCSHGRCRTCCKSRGFDCVTHVKSTWVPAARRRERQLMGGGTSGGAGSTGSSSGTKKPRLVASQTTTTSHTSTSNTTPPRSFDTSSSHQGVSFKESLPRQVRAPAVFKCVRVTALEDGEDEYAYQAMVKINGHVFKGFLYDKGVETRNEFPNISELHLGGGGRNINGHSLSSPIIDPSDVYAASSGGAGLLGAASSFGNPIN